ncbi:MAG: hypothetical protein H6601_10690 [Flavobacteriales bacterium]|nr:hypothetical protein [Flavobacteriales bacterium]
MDDMILVADSGSTKCDWKLIDGNNVVGTASTMGLNPFFHNAEVVADTVSTDALLRANSQQISEVHFYGAGCSSVDRNQLIENGLKRVFANAKVHVDHDVMGAALAACQGQPGIACILGTGSNACFYDGEKVTQQIPSLGYILGDEGSGSWYGKKLLRDYLYKEAIPSELRTELQNSGFDKDTILNRIYREPHANVYLASFVKILSNYRDTEYVQNMISNGMTEFLTRHVCCFPSHKEVKVGFVGSIAFHFQESLRAEAQKLNITVGNIVKQPIDGLVAFHLS